MNNSIILKGRNDRLEIYLNKDVDFSFIEDNLIHKLNLSNGFFEGSNLAVEFIGRNLEIQEEDKLLWILEQNNINVSYLVSNNNSSATNHKTEKYLLDEGITKFHKGSLRSGTSLDFHGNIVILGDINPGASIKASGNIVVLGYLNGNAWAGSKDSREAFIASLNMNPIQLRIGDLIARDGKTDVLGTNRIKKANDLEIAFIKDEKIIIEHFNKEALKNMVKF